MKRYKDKYIKAWVKQEVGEAFGNRLKAKMDEQGISINSLAKNICVERKNVWNWLHGMATPRWYYIRLLEDALGCTADYLITGEE